MPYEFSAVSQTDRFHGFCWFSKQTGNVEKAWNTVSEWSEKLTAYKFSMLARDIGSKEVQNGLIFLLMVEKYIIECNRHSLASDAYHIHYEIPRP